MRSEVMSFLRTQLIDNAAPNNVTFRPCTDLSTENCARQLSTTTIRLCGRTGRFE
jgi:hypothetical protein